MSGKTIQENKVDSVALGYFVLCWGAFENTQGIEPQLVERALADTKGPPVRTQTLHRGTPNTHIRA
jgi:L-fucose isomerase-like protein